ncbi:MAG TPA: preprotein translocase subunit SecG [Thermodesulfovibrio thiophilus]|nr:preprotein translocase subunit SecG [Thermodesulfovibrio thiophilus]
MKTLLLTFHIILCLVMIAVVLLHRGKGAELGPAFGGGSSQTLFGPRGAATFLNKVATIVAVLFMLSSFFLTYITTRNKSVVSDVNIPQQTQSVQPAQQPTGEQPQQK